jgi:hypothetical protein
MEDIMATKRPKPIPTTLDTFDTFGDEARTTPGRAWLDVPYAEKDAAKALGAIWDPTAKRWYAPPGTTKQLSPWAPLPDVPDLLPGEDRAFGEGLFVDPVPSSCWFTNVRSCVAPRDWARLRRMILGRAGHRCEACGRSATSPVSWSCAAPESTTGAAFFLRRSGPGRHADDEAIAEYAQLARTSPETIRYWRHIGKGPRGFKVGRRAGD